MKFSRCLCCLLVPGILAAASFTLTAQTTGAPESATRVQPPKTPGIMQNPNAGFAVGGPVGMLTEPQRASYETALNSVRGQMAELQAKLRTARQDFLVTSLDQKFDENVLRQKAFAAARCEAELAVLRAKALSQIQPPLTAEQIEKIKAGQPGPVQPLRRQQPERPAQHAPTSGTNQDANGLPPKK
jgi:Spy/CpxP family protein refolding chaperone